MSNTKTDFPILKREELDEDYLKTYHIPFLEQLNRPRTRVEYERHLLYVSSYFKWSRGKRYLFTDFEKEDAKEYFLNYLSKECSSGRLSYDTFRLRLSTCQSFCKYIEELQVSMYPDLTEEERWKNPFDSIIRPAAPLPVRKEKVLNEKELDYVLSSAKTFDKRLYIIYLLSFRMGLKQKELLSLKKDNFDFFEEKGRFIGLLKLIRNQGPVYLRVPADIVVELSEYVLSSADYLFLNERGNQMNSVNLTRLSQSFQDHIGMYVTLSMVRSKGLIDLVASNQGNENGVIDYTGLSGITIKGYAKALDYIEDGCVADNCSLKILKKE